MAAALIYWQTATPGVVLTSILERTLAEEAEGRDKDGCMANHVVCRRWAPPGAVAWSYHAEGPWLPMEACPLPPKGVIAPSSKYGWYETRKATKGKRP